MGAYLSDPITKKISTDESGEGISYGASCMQGWRVDQEDAHNTILEFDKDMSLFAVYDGHGGHEVSAYAADKLPNFLKGIDAYQKGNLSQGLVDAFLAFDQSLVDPSILEILKELKTGETKDDLTEDGSESEREEVNHLCREASMPLEQVMARYGKDEKFQSPALRGKLRRLEGCSSSNEGRSNSSNLVKYDLEDEQEQENPNNTKDSQSDATISSDATLSSSVDMTDEASCDSKVNGKVTESDDKTPPNKTNHDDLDHRINGEVNNSEVKVENNKNITSETEKTKENGEIIETELNGNLEEGKGKGKGKSIKGKGKAVLRKPETKPVTTGRNVEKRRDAAVKGAEMYLKFQKGNDIEELSDEEDSDMDNYEDDAKPKSLTEAADSEDVEEDEDDDEGDESEDDDDDDSDSDDEGFKNYQANTEFLSMKEEPGFDSGCTACVAVLHGIELYVANVGDSRAVVCRDGKALDMSIDHKPEDEPETKRIMKAGGRVTSDGRVNNGLNLSRALGDHGYKTNKALPAEDQMISPLPDVKTVTLTKEDTFMIVACDGIWNSMSSQEACDFVSERIDKDKKLSIICEQMFTHCLAPNILGDGTGCDNMTCVIIRFDNLNILDSASAKRSSELSDNSSPDQKKLKSNDE